MQRKPTLPSAARHARLFELLRQENNALSVRRQAAPPAPVDRITEREFREIAMRSFARGHATL